MLSSELVELELRVDVSESENSGGSRRDGSHTFFRGALSIQLAATALWFKSLVRKNE
jgi:hypothetical protein